MKLLVPNHQVLELNVVDGREGQARRKAAQQIAGSEVCEGSEKTEIGLNIMFRDLHPFKNR